LILGTVDRKRAIWSRREYEMNSSIKRGGMRRLARVVAMVFFVAMLAVPAAFGGGRQGLDPWAYNVLHRIASEAITEHSAGQNAAPGVERGGLYGPSDPWAYRVLYRTPSALITEHSAGQNPNRHPIAATADFVPAAVGAGGFDWSDAGIGAGAAFALLALTGTVVMRRRHTVAQAQL
jgi:hypothetical protein